MSDELQDLADDVRELTEKRQHNEPIWGWSHQRNRKKLGSHITTVPSLLDQLRELVAEPATDSDDGRSHSIPDSRTPEGSRAFELLMAIEAGTARWMADVFGVPARPTPEDNLRGMVAAATVITAEGHSPTRIAADVAGWRRQAEEITGWRDPALHPYVRCPTCTRLGTLRVDVHERHARCVACNSTWSDAEGTIGLLAEHIRAERT